MNPIETALSKIDNEIALVREWSPEELIIDAERCADLLAENGVMLWWPDKDLTKQRRRVGKPLQGCDGVEADPDEVFAALIRGLAILALRPHGVEFDTMHICDNRHQGLCERGEVSFPTVPENTNSRGATFTPRSLAEMVTNHTLDAIVYKPGPLETGDRNEWRLIPPAEILSKKIGDIAVGCGVFPLAALRYLTDRIQDHLNTAEATQHLVDIRSTIIARCLYGVDIHPGSIAITRLVMALMVPTIDMDILIYRKFLCGDSLLGITSMDQLRWMHLDPEKGRQIHGTQPIPDELLERK